LNHQCQSAERNAEERAYLTITLVAHVSGVEIYKSLFTKNSLATRKQYSTGINTNKAQNTTIKSITSSFFTKLNYFNAVSLRSVRSTNKSLAFYCYSDQSSKPSPCQSTDPNPGKLSTGVNPFFTNHWTLDGRDTAPIILALQCH